MMKGVLPFVRRVHSVLRIHDHARTPVPGRYFTDASCAVSRDYCVPGPVVQCAARVHATADPRMPNATIRCNVTFSPLY